MRTECFLLVLVSSSLFILAHAQQPQGSCSACSCQLNSVESLQSLVESIVNQSLDARVPAAVNQAVDSRIQSVSQQINASIDEKIVNSQSDVPGKLLRMHTNTFFIVSDSSVNLINMGELKIMFELFVKTVYIHL